MEPGVMLRIIMIATGVLLFGFTLSSLARRRLTEPFCMTWGLVSVIIVLAGILLRPDEWNRYISTTGMLMMVVFGFCVIYGTLFMSAKVSGLMRRNQELAMQVSLLKHENEVIRERLGELCELCGAYAEGQDGWEEHSHEKSACGNQYAGACRGGDGASGASAPFESGGI